MEEVTLVKLAKDGNPEALRMLYEDNKKKMFTLAYHYVRNIEDAEDILQETFIKAYQYLDTYKPIEGKSFSSWLYRISINCCLDHLRKQKTGRGESKQINNIESVPSYNKGAGPEHTSQVKDIRVKIEQFLNTLPPRQKMIFILKHYQELTTKEIAEYLKCTEGSVKKQLFRVVSSLKRQLRKYFPEKDYEM